MVDTYVAPLADSFIDKASSILEKSTSYILNQRRSDAALQLRDAEQAMVEDLEKLVDENQSIHANTIKSVFAEREALKLECARLREIVRRGAEDIHRVESAQGATLVEVQEHARAAGNASNQLRNEKRISDELRRKVDELESEVGILRSKVEEKEDRESTAVKSASDANAKLLEADESNAALKRDAAGLKDDLSATERRVVALMKENRELVGTVSKLAAEKRTLIEEVHSSNEQRISSGVEDGKHIAERDLQLSAARKALAERESELASAQEMIAERDAQLKSAQSTLDRRDLDLKTLSRKLENRDADIKSARASIAERSAEVDEMQDIVAELESQLEKARSKLRDCESEIHQKTENISSMENTLRDYKEKCSRLESLEQKNDHLERNVSSLTSALEMSKSELDSAAPAIKALQESNAENTRTLQATIHDLERENEDLRSKMQIDEELSLGTLRGLEKKIGSLEDQRNLLEARMEEYDAIVIERDQLSKKVSLLEKECVGLKETCNALSSVEERNKVLGDAKCRLEKEVATMASFLESAKAAHDSTAADTQAAKEAAITARAAERKARQELAAFQVSSENASMIASKEAEEMLLRQRELLEEKESAAVEARARVDALEVELQASSALVEKHRRLAAESKRNAHEDKLALLSKIEALELQDHARLASAEEKLEAERKTLAESQLRMVDDFAKERDSARARFVEQARELARCKERAAAAEKKCDDLELAMNASNASLRNAAAASQAAEKRISSLEIAAKEHMTVAAALRYENKQLDESREAYGRRVRATLEAFSAVLGEKLEVAISAVMFRIGGIDGRLRSASAQMQQHILAKVTEIKSPSDPEEKLNMQSLLSVEQETSRNLREQLAILKEQKTEVEVQLGRAVAELEETNRMATVDQTTHATTDVSADQVEKIMDQLRVSQDECATLRNVIEDMRIIKDANKETVSAAASAVETNTKVLSEEIVVLRESTRKFEDEVQRLQCALDDTLSDLKKAKACVVSLQSKVRETEVDAENAQARDALVMKALRFELERSKETVKIREREHEQCENSLREDLRRNVEEMANMRRSLEQAEIASSALAMERDELVAAVRRLEVENSTAGQHSVARDVPASPTPASPQSSASLPPNKNKEISNVDGNERVRILQRRLDEETKARAAAQDAVIRLEEMVTNAKEQREKHSPPLTLSSHYSTSPFVSTSSPPPDDSRALAAEEHFRSMLRQSEEMRTKEGKRAEKMREQLRASGQVNRVLVAEVETLRRQLVDHDAAKRELSIICAKAKQCLASPSLLQNKPRIRPTFEHHPAIESSQRALDELRILLRDSKLEPDIAQKKTSQFENAQNFAFKMIRCADMVQYRRACKRMGLIVGRQSRAQRSK